MFCWGGTRLCRERVVLSKLLSYIAVQMQHDVADRCDKPPSEALLHPLAEFPVLPITAIMSTAAAWPCHVSPVDHSAVRGSTRQTLANDSYRRAAGNRRCPPIHADGPEAH